MLISEIVFFNDTATTEIYTLSLHDALPISLRVQRRAHPARLPHGRHASGAPRGRAVPAHATRLTGADRGTRAAWCASRDRKSTRLNSSHANISYAVFCLKKKSDGHLLAVCV